MPHDKLISSFCVLRALSNKTQNNKVEPRVNQQIAVEELATLKEEQKSFIQESRAFINEIRNSYNNSQRSPPINYSIVLTDKQYADYTRRQN